MSMVTWDPSYSVKVQRCDDDHKKLFALFNSLHDAMMKGEGSKIMGRIVKELADYTRYHFAQEETLLERTKYPALESHRAQHREFVDKVEEFEREVKVNNLTQSPALLKFLSGWLSNHIMRTDKLYSTHLNNNGVS
ncbi:MAG TPA: bacteriohemerythrin [Terriglobales bacterium]|nr:bacteriohemerythrin [Terriglobales bacterium]